MSAMKHLGFLFSLLILSGLCQAQFTPQAGVSGSDAIHKSSAAIQSWANACFVQRGLMDISDAGSSPVSVGIDADATGAADGMVVSLGDSGVAVLSFANRIFDGPGADFAVFENGFANPANPEESFMELAFVEVSSDGVHFYRFPSVSNIATASQTPGAGVYLNARQVNNLAGKHITQYGTPFDLAELKGISGLDVDRISHIRIVDVIGAINGHSSRDSKGQVINDPYPTKFPSGGFDLDAVAALHTVSSGIREFAESGIRLFPVPANEEISVSSADVLSGEIVLMDLQGRPLQTVSVNGNRVNLSLTAIPAGTYFLSLTQNNGSRCVGTFSKY